MYSNRVYCFVIYNHLLSDLSAQLADIIFMAGHGIDI